MGMEPQTKFGLSKFDLSKFWLGTIAIALISFTFRFWRLDSISTLVFDEVYYVKFANHYLQGLPLFDAHPPLGKYLIALSIQLFGDNPFGHRALNALAGALIPLVTCALVLTLSNQRSWALWAGFYTSMDGLLLVESRFGLINIYLVLFGMMSQLCLAVALHPQNSQNQLKSFCLVVASGLFMGASISVKWSGITYLVGLGAIALYFRSRFGRKLSLGQTAGALFVVFSTYLIIWIPHLALNPSLPDHPGTNLWQIHQNIFSFHRNLGVGKTEPIHPYCSVWWSWVLLIRPIAYYYQTQPHGTSKMIEYVNAMGNPFLYWLGAIAIFSSLGLCLNRFIKDLPLPWIWLITLSSFFGHLLPWSLSQRCTFLYHYLPASVYAFIAIALITDWCLSDRRRSTIIRIIGQAIPILITFGFVFWLPIYTGLPITQWQYHLQVWFSSWV